MRGNPPVLYDRSRNRATAWKILCVALAVFEDLFPGLSDNTAKFITVEVERQSRIFFHYIDMTARHIYRYHNAAHPMMTVIFIA